MAHRVKALKAKEVRISHSLPTPSLVRESKAKEPEDELEGDHFKQPASIPGAFFSS